jgi:GT2 family glycosyltransferase
MRPTAVAGDQAAVGAPAAAPVLVRDIEVAEPLPELPPVDGQGRRVERAWLLVRVFTEPVGALEVDMPEAGLSPSGLATALLDEHGSAIRARLADAGAPTVEALPLDGVHPPQVPAFLARRTEVLRTAPAITVVVCTRERPVPLARCLDSLLAQQYPRFRVLVVDNAPTSRATADVVADAATRGPVDYLVAPLPGLARARNVAVESAAGEILAWLDDDEVADPFWLSEVARALADHPEADVVSGVIVPAELETRAQVWFEQFGGHSKGRGFTPAVFSPATARIQHPLYPLPPFATGANMTFRPGVVERFGGFDAALGAGTPALASEDTLAFMHVLRTGGTIVYQPSAVTRHYHRRDLEGLRGQLVGYGRGLTAAYTSLVLRDPRALLALLGLVPTALRDLTSAGSQRVAGLGADFPRHLLSANRRAMLAGPFAYLRGRLGSRRRRPIRSRL